MSARTHKIWISLVVVGVFGALASCGVEEPLSPVGSFADGGVDGSGGQGGGSADAGPKRTVMTRNPFGNVAASDNLLWDGDFEWYSPFSDQYGWLSGPPYGYSFPNVEVGPQCRSGLKCALIKKGKGILGLGVASQGNQLEASFWAKVTMGTCDQVKGTVTDIFSPTMSDTNVKVPAIDTAPDADGWCHYQVIVSPRESKPSLMIQNSTGGDVLIDDAILRKAPPAKVLNAPIEAPEADLVLAIEAARSDVAKLKGPFDPPPNERRRAFEAWKNR